MDAIIRVPFTTGCPEEIRIDRQILCVHRINLDRHPKSVTVYAMKIFFQKVAHCLLAMSRGIDRIPKMLDEYRLTEGREFMAQ
jgi:hypothetical protein